MKNIVDPVAKRRACFTSCLENFRVNHKGSTSLTPQVAQVNSITHILPTNEFEDSLKMGNENLDFIPNKELDKEDLVPIPSESKDLSKVVIDCDLSEGGLRLLHGC